MNKGTELEALIAKIKPDLKLAQDKSLPHSVSFPAIDRLSDVLTFDVLSELIAALEQAQQRIDELEAASVKPLCVKLPPRKTAEYFVDDTFGNSDLAAIYNACRLECEVRIKNAGGTVEGEQ